jgi:aryl-alcohol dehydrogenase-like predicted oxidoreductase
VPPIRGLNDGLPVCERYGMGVITWSPLAGGWLTGSYRKGRELPRSTRSERLPARFDISLPANREKLRRAVHEWRSQGVLPRSVGSGPKKED